MVMAVVVMATRVVVAAVHAHIHSTGSNGLEVATRQRGGLHDFAGKGQISSHMCVCVHISQSSE